MKHLASAKNQSEMCPGQGCMPATPSSVDSDPIRAAVKEAPQYGSAITEVPEYAQLLPQAPGLADVRDRIAGDVVTKVLDGDITPEQGATELQKSAQAAVDEATK